MKIKPIFLVMLVCLLTLSFGLVSCGSTDDGGGGGGNVPAALQGNWLRDDAGTERYLKFTKDGWGTDSTSFGGVSIHFIVTAATATTITWNLQYVGTGSFDYDISGSTLTISNSTGPGSGSLATGTYERQ
ncbi:MAG: hypothetical protein FWG35_01265 [Spirochaetaceae bacterium]|nr:hypothetical protein [Spirochaetaceae bacterium]